ncbi:hypothetical protein KR51_00000160 [Rubidibacter lacunae KORDI 51-2]|uniref:Uncharacterized protein n=1 Tax=Rubidibacter lacunae KORDI 51-2 TaxID=582515 RepID=U5DQN1_9CHRO|nr:hypothetical protein [Rubidibacter lacunae]ERN43127.1 hypothetical protein KR51_00000160 [Rubidibacter lacunae KORDI 51-2]
MHRLIAFVFLVVVSLIDRPVLGMDGPPNADAETGTGSLVWVAKSYSVGEQCRRYEEPPTPETELKLVGVEVYAEVIERKIACLACGCPSYVAVHYAEIRESDLELSVESGFERSDPPNRD